MRRENNGDKVVNREKVEIKHVSRRRFMIETGAGTAALATLAALGLPSVAGAKPKIEFIRTSCGEQGKGAKKVLVAYDSECGSTGGVAKAIAEEFCAMGASADVKLAGEVGDISQYGAVVVGAAIRSFKWLADARSFVADNETLLSKLPVAYFMTCIQIVEGQPAMGKGASKNETPEQKRARMLAYMDKVLEKSPSVKPVDIGVFGGALDFDKLTSIERRMMKSMKFHAGDFRDFDKIRQWARDIAPKLLKA